MNERAVIVSALLIAISLPMILKAVPRNRFYGFRTPYTLSSDAVWYYANRVAGIAFFIAAAVWLALAALIPRYVPGEIVTGLVVGLGLACLVAATVISFWVVYRKR